MLHSHSVAAETQAAFRALADPTRREILLKLSNEDMTIGEIAGQFTVTRGAIKKHLIILEEGGLISVRQHGRERINSLEPMALKTVDDWLHHFHQFWDEKLNKLKDAAEKAEQSKAIERKL